MRNYFARGRKRYWGGSLFPLHSLTLAPTLLSTHLHRLHTHPHAHPLTQNHAHTPTRLRTSQCSLGFYLFFYLNFLFSYLPYLLPVSLYRLPIPFPLHLPYHLFLSLSLSLSLLHPTDLFILSSISPTNYSSASNDHSSYIIILLINFPSIWSNFTIN